MANSTGKINDDNLGQEGLENISHEIIYQYINDVISGKWKRAAGTPDGKTKVETTPATGIQQEVIIVDADDTNKKGSVDASGRQLVSTQPPAAPGSATAITQIADGNLGNNEINNIYYTVTNGKTLTVQRFTAAASGGTTGGWEMELYLDPDGDVDGNDPVQGSWILLSLAFIPETGGNFFEDITPTDLIGDGTARIVLRRVRVGGGGLKRGFVKFSGFEL